MCLKWMETSLLCPGGAASALGYSWEFCGRVLLKCQLLGWWWRRAHAARLPRDRCAGHSKPPHVTWSLCPWEWSCLLESNWLQGLWETVPNPLSRAHCELLWWSELSPDCPCPGMLPGVWSPWSWLRAAWLQPASIPGYQALRHALHSSRHHEVCCALVCMVKLSLSLDWIVLLTHSQCSPEPGPSPRGCTAPGLTAGRGCHLVLGGHAKQEMVQKMGAWLHREI